jgi:hypothetical protein
MALEGKVGIASTPERAVLCATCVTVVVVTSGRAAGDIFHARGETGSSNLPEKSAAGHLPHCLSKSALVSTHP